jgi:hypothetical protein
MGPSRRAVGVHAMAEGPLRLSWRVLDGLDYLWTLTTLRILDGLVGPLPETPVISSGSGIGAAGKGVPWDRAKRSPAPRSPVAPIASSSETEPPA